MFRKPLSFGGMLLLAGAAALATPSLGQAQHGGGGHGGGHGGGGHFGGTQFGGARLGGYRAGSYSGGRYGGFRNSYYPHNGYAHHYYGTYPLYGYYPSYGLNSYGSGYAGSYSYDPMYSVTYPDAYPYDNPSLQPDLRDSGSYESVAPTAPYSFGQLEPDTQTGAFAGASGSSNQPADTTVHVSVRVPAGAEIWFGGSRTISKGSVREFQSPSLTPGYQYTYEVRARWNENGHEVTQTQQVEVTAGARVEVDFPLGPKSAQMTSVTENR
jgi:uncharacterized protein (TIGR03000 family)